MSEIEKITDKFFDDLYKCKDKPCSLCEIQHEAKIAKSKIDLALSEAQEKWYEDRGWNIVGKEDT